MAGAEAERLAEDTRRERNWKRWGPYLAERQWGTVREDYSPDGNVWEYFSHDQARSRAYRWGEDGLLGITDRQGRLCFALALWNGRDPILKERLFGLTGPEGNHGEDVKEAYFYLDSTPTHSYLKALYKYPQAEFPYERAGPGQPRARQGGARVRADRHRRVRRSALLRRLRRVRQGRYRRHPDPHHGGQPRARGRDGPSPADALVPEHLELGTRGGGLLAQAQHPPERTGRAWSPSTAVWGATRWTPRLRRPALPRSSSSPTTRPTSPGSSAHPIRSRT